LLLTFYSYDFAKSSDVAFYPTFGYVKDCYDNGLKSSIRNL